MIRSITGLCMGLVLLCQSITGQTVKAQLVKYVQPPSTGAHPLTVGDIMPNFRLPEMMNYSSPSACINDFRSQLTILDFWSTSCSTCISLFPHMQALQQKFAGQLKIVLVNSQTQIWRDNRSKISSLLQRLKPRLGDIFLPITLNAQALDSAFPAQTLPEEIWIDGSGKIIGITGPNEVNEDNIAAILAGKQIRMHLKRDVSIHLDETTLQEWYYGQPDKEHPSPYSAILVKGYIDGLNGYGVRQIAKGNTNKLYTGYYMANRPALHAVLQAYANIIQVPLNQVQLKVRDTALFSAIYPSDSSLYSRVFSYDITVPATTYTNLMQYVQQDIARAFQITVDTGTALLPCLVVELSDKFKHSKDTIAYWPDTRTGEGGVRGYPLHDLIKNLNQYSALPLLDSTASHLPVDLQLPTYLGDTEAIIHCLEKAGLKITRTKKLFPVAYIKDDTLMKTMN